MKSENKEVFSGKTFSELLKDIYDNQVHKKKQIEILINELRPLISSTNEAAVIVPLIKDYLEVGVRNDEQLVKIAGVFQKYLASEDRVAAFANKPDSGILTDAEKEQLLNEVADELMKEENIIETSGEIEKKFSELMIKSKTIQTEVSGSGEINGI
jgi:hypothetical protein